MRMQHCQFQKGLLVQTIFFLIVPDWDEGFECLQWPLTPFETVPIEMLLCF